MKIVLTVVRPGPSANCTDLVLSSPPGTPFGRLRDRLVEVSGAAPGTELFHGSTRIPDDWRLGAPPLTDGAVLCADRPGLPDRRGLLELHVRSGPDSGSVHRLGPGEYTIGRSPLAAIALDDPDVSRFHALLTVGTGAGSGTRVADTRSTNGTLLDGHPVGSRGCDLRPGQVVAVGSSTLVLSELTTDAASCRADGAGRVVVNRPPRHLPPEVGAQLSLPSRPAPAPSRGGLPALATAVPLLLGVLLSVITRSPAYLVFALMSPLMLVGAHVGDRLSGRRQARETTARYAAAETAVRASATAALSAEHSARHERFPDPATLMTVVSTPSSRLWERTPADRDFLELRLGLGDIRSRVELRSPPAGELSESIERLPLTGVPVTVAVPAAGVVGICGDSSGAIRLGRFLMAQVAGWHSPTGIRVAALVDDLEEWAWLRWLPHVRLPADSVAIASTSEAGRCRDLIHWLVEELDARQSAAKVGSPRRHRETVVTVLAGAESLRARTGIARLLVEGPSAGLFFVCIEDTWQQLPNECRATVEVTGDVGTRLRVLQTDGACVDDVVLDGVSRRWAERLARALAALRDATPDDDVASLPATARLLDLLGLPSPDAPTLVARWAHDRPGLGVPLGVGARGEPVQVDLVTDGPHLLVAGTTGAGKSELLQSLIAGLAARTPPHLLSFLLIDYKGGAAFAHCARLPHTVGLVTDLDGMLSERALASLTAELRRRERLLRGSGCPNLDAYNAVNGSDALPRLVLVVDEFATLADELPEFLGGLVSVAQRGRSLGVHLVLATQRPGRAVNADIRANVSLRIALRVSDPHESTDIVDVDEAAFLPRDVPGRAIVRTGTGVVNTMQTALVTGHAASATDPAVRRWAWDASAPREVERRADSGPSDLERLVTACQAAAAQLRLRPARSPWLPPLPAVLPVDELPVGEGLGIGLIDLPAEQRTETLQLHLGGAEHLLVVGGPGSGRTTALRTLAGQVLRVSPADPAHLYVFDGGGSLGMLTAAASCGAVVGRDQVDRGTRLVQLLDQELDRRLLLLAERGLGGLGDLPGEERPPWVIVLVDGWESLQERYAEVDHGRPLDLMLRLLRDGGSVGMSFVVSGGRGLLTSRVAGSFRRRVALPSPDPADYAAVGPAARQRPTEPRPGRGVLLPGGEEIQLAVLGHNPAGTAQNSVLAELAHAAGSREESDRPPIRVEPLPQVARLADIEAESKAVSPGCDWTLLGVGGDDAGPVGVDLHRDGPWLLVAGGPGSGRSTALLTAATWLLGEGRQIMIAAAHRSPLRVLADLPRVTVLDTDPGALRQMLGDAPATVVVDDAEHLRDTAIERAVLDAAHADTTQQLSFLVGCSLTEALTAFRGLAVEARRGRTGLLLGALGPGDGEIFGLRLPRSAAGPAGRGLLVTRGAAAPVQVALPENAGGYR